MWLQLSSCVCLNSPCTKCRSYLLKLISIWGHFLTVNNRRYGRCYVKYIIPLCTFLEFYTHLEGNSARSFENAFRKCSRALNMMFLKTSCFWWMSSFFRLLSHLKLFRLNIHVWLKHSRCPERQTLFLSFEKFHLCLWLFHCGLWFYANE